MSVHRICRETVVRSFVTRNADGIMESATRRVPCNSDKWSDVIEVPVASPSRPGAGDTIVRMQRRRATRPFCENGHPMGGW